MNVMNVTVQLGEGNALSDTSVFRNNDASLGKREWETKRNPSNSDTKKGYLDNVTTSSSSHADKTGCDANKLNTSSGRTRLQSSFPTEEDDEEELHNDVLRNVVKVDGARKSQALDRIRGGSSAMQSEIPTDMPGLSIITWEEFVANPSLMHNLFTLDKEEFIQFDNTVVNNLFHDSRMEPPNLGGPSGDGLSWQIFVESYSQLRHVREVMTSRISVLLVDLVKPNNEGTAACVVAINPMDDHIRRVLHLTLSRAMESVFNSRCFSVEINLNNDITTWCRMVLQTECQVAGGRIVITNGDEPQPFCVVDNPPRCVLCFPVWLYKRIKYILMRRRRYDDTMVEFEGANFVLCTKSETLRHYSETAQLTHGERLIHKNSRAVTMATQTLNTSCTSLKSDLSVEEIDEASDNDVIERRNVPNERGRDLYSFDNPSFGASDIDDDNITYNTQVQHSDVEGRPSDKPVVSPTATTAQNSFKSSVDGVTLSLTQAPAAPVPKNRNKKSYNVSIPETQSVGKELDIVASANLAEQTQQEMPTKGEDRFIKNTKDFNEILREDINKSFDESADEQVLTPRSKAAFLKRPFTPFVKKLKDLKKNPKSPRQDKVQNISELKLPLEELSKPALDDKDGAINDKIAKRQKKINDLMSDLVSSNSTTNLNLSLECNDNDTGEYNEHLNDGIITPETPRREVKKPVPAKRNIKETPVKEVQMTPRDNPVFPYTTELLDFPSARDALEKYGADLRKGKLQKHFKTDDMLFQPRLNLDDIEPDRNCFSDQDISDSDVTDLENEGAMSDTEGMLSARYIPVQTTPRTLSLNPAIHEMKRDNKPKYKNDLDSELEITDCDTEEETTNYKQMNSPRILPGALAAHEMRAASAGTRSRGGSANLRSRDYIPPSAQMNRRGGNQNDSRRRYLALNSLRRKAYKLALQSHVRSQSKRPSSAAQLVSYNTRDENEGDNSVSNGDNNNKNNILNNSRHCHGGVVAVMSTV